MIVIWTGWGFWTFGILVGVPGLVAAATTLIWGEPTFDNHPAILGLGLLCAAGINVWLGLRLNRRPARVLIDEKTGRKVKLKRRHTIFFVEMQYWSLPIAVWGLVLVARELIGAAS